VEKVKNFVGAFAVIDKVTKEIVQINKGKFATPQMLAKHPILNKSSSKYIELASHEDFQSIFIESTSLP